MGYSGAARLRRPGLCHWPAAHASGASGQDLLDGELSGKPPREYIKQLMIRATQMMDDLIALAKRYRCCADTAEQYRRRRQNGRWFSGSIAHRRTVTQFGVFEHRSSLVFSVWCHDAWILLHSESVSCRWCCTMWRTDVDGAVEWLVEVVGESSWWFVGVAQQAGRPFRREAMNCSSSFQFLVWVVLGLPYRLPHKS